MPTKRQYQEATLTSLTTEASSWRPHWQELQQFILPRRGRFLSTDVNKGSKKNSSILDNTATLAARTLASGMMSGITSPARPWFRLTPPDPGMKEFAPVKLWLSQVEKLLLEIFAKSNIYNALHVSYGELGTFGTSPIFIKEDFNDVIRAYPFTVGSYYAAIDDRLTVNTLYREIPMTVINVVKQFGIDKVTPATRDMYTKKNYQAWIEVIHAIEPNQSRDISKIDNTNMAFSSDYWEKGSNEDQYLSKGGFNEMPAMTPRWEVLGTDVYGRSPGMDALGDTKQLQIQQKQKAKAIAKQIDPPMVGAAELQGKGANTLPGGVTYTDVTAAGAGFTPAYQINFDLSGMKDDIFETQQRIKRAYYEDLFLMLSQSDRRQITAREVEEKHEEKLLMLGSVMERLNDELLDPLIDRTFNIALRAGILPPIPQELQDGGDIKVEYISIMAQAQKMVGTTGLERLAGFAGQLAGVDASVVDKINTDQMLDEYADMLGVPPGTVNSDDEVAAVRQEHNKMEQQATGLEVAERATDMAKTASETSVTDEESLLNQIADTMDNNIPG